MRESIEELIVLTECRLKLATVGDTYSISNAVQSQAELIAEENKQEKAALIKEYSAEDLSA